MTSESYERKVKISGKATVKKGDFVKFEQELSDKGDKASTSGQVIAVNKGEVVIRKGRPYLVSPGTMLLVDL